MKIAVLSDVHGNLPALEAVLEDIERRRPDRVVVNGDLLNRGPLSLEVLQLLRRAQPAAELIRGNHENYLLACAEGRIENGIADIDCLAEWTVAHLGEEVAALKEWHTELALEDMEGGSSLHITHGSLLGDRCGIHPETDEAALAERIGDVRDLFIASHTHKAFSRRFRGTLVVNTGSVGQPFDGDPRAAYGFFTFSKGRWSAESVRLEYDRERALRDFHDSGFIDEAGPLAALIEREVRECRIHVGRWRDEYLQAVKSGAIGVAESIAQYQRRYD